MKKPTIRIHNIETNEIIDREMTDTEFAEYETQKTLDVAGQEAKAKVIADKEAALSKLAALGLTADDLKALGL